MPSADGAPVPPDGEHPLTIKGNQKEHKLHRGHGGRAQRDAKPRGLVSIDTARNNNNNSNNKLTVAAGLVCNSTRAELIALRAVLRSAAELTINEC